MGIHRYARGVSLELGWVRTPVKHCSRPLQVDGGMCPTAITNSPVCCAMPWVEPPKYSCCWDLFWIPCEFFWCHNLGGVLTCFERLCSYQLIVTNPCKSGGLTKGVMSEQTMIVSRVYTRENRRHHVHWGQVGSHGISFTLGEFRSTFSLREVAQVGGEPLPPWRIALREDMVTIHLGPQICGWLLCVFIVGSWMGSAKVCLLFTRSQQFGRDCRCFEASLASSQGWASLGQPGPAWAMGGMDNSRGPHRTSTILQWSLSPIAPIASGRWWTNALRPTSRRPRSEGRPTSTRDSSWRWGPGDVREQTGWNLGPLTPVIEIGTTWLFDLVRDLCTYMPKTRETHIHRFAAFAGQKGHCTTFGNANCEMLKACRVLHCHRIQAMSSANTPGAAT